MLLSRDKRILFTVILILLVGIGQMFFRNKNKRHIPQQNTTTEQVVQGDILYKGRKVEITKHGKCRMGCRHIDSYEVQEVVDKGQINHNKSRDAAEEGKCPTVALEGYTRDQQHVRIVIADCGSGTPHLVTVIDLENDFKCDCY